LADGDLTAEGADNAEENTLLVLSELSAPSVAQTLDFFVSREGLFWKMTP
jgi:hypothetical protein